jgi:alkylation response protein AidB-like acyl-CoA dehydrogenase
MHEVTLRRILKPGTAASGPLASYLKIRGSEIQQQIAELTCDALGPALPCAGLASNGAWNPLPIEANGASESFLYTRASSIYGGSNEIQRNVIAKALLHG